MISIEKDDSLISTSQSPASWSNCVNCFVCKGVVVGDVIERLLPIEGYKAPESAEVIYDVANAAVATRPCGVENPECERLPHMRLAARVAIEGYSEVGIEPFDIGVFRDSSIS